MTRGSIGPSSKTSFILRLSLSLSLSPTHFIEYQTALYVKKKSKALPEEVMKTQKGEWNAWLLNLL